MLCYDCKQCDYQATLQSYLTRQKQSTNNKVMYNCEECDYQSKEKGSLAIHKYSKHNMVWYDYD